MRLTDFKVLTFDCYGTLIDWETGIWTALQPLLARLPSPPGREGALAAFAAHETYQAAATPRMRYADLLAVVHGRLTALWGAAPDQAADRAFAAALPRWPAFADSPATLQYLKRYYRLVVLSNVDRDGFAASNKRLMVEFDAVCTAEDIGSYKPAPGNFEYLLQELAGLGFTRPDILHIAQSLFHDHGPARALGIASAWIDRRQDRGGWGATLPPPQAVTPTFRFPSLAALVAAHRQALREAG